MWQLDLTFEQICFWKEIFRIEKTRFFLFNCNSFVLKINQLNAWIIQNVTNKTLLFLTLNWKWNFIWIYFYLFSTSQIWLLFSLVVVRRQKLTPIKLNHKNYNIPAWSICCYFSACLWATVIIAWLLLIVTLFVCYQWDINLKGKYFSIAFILV